MTGPSAHVRGAKKPQQCRGSSRLLTRVGRSCRQPHASSRCQAHVTSASADRRRSSAPPWSPQDVRLRCRIVVLVHARRGGRPRWSLAARNCAMKLLRAIRCRIAWHRWGAHHPRRRWDTPKMSPLRSGRGGRGKGPGSLGRSPGPGETPVIHGGICLAALTDQRGSVRCHRRRPIMRSPSESESSTASRSIRTS
jgi:hypothetical protein